MTLKIKLFLLGVLIALSGTSQTASFKDVKKLYLQNFKPIIENNEVKGYFLFYFLDKASKKENLYAITILDNSLKQVATKEVILPKKTYLIDCAFNETNFCFVFLEMKENRLEYVIYDKALNNTGKYTVNDLSNSEVQMIAQNIGKDEENSGLNGGGVAAINGKGFVRYGLEKGDGYRIDLDAFDNSGKKLWTANSNATTKKSYESILPIYSNDKVLVSSMTVRPKLLSQKDLENFIVMHDALTGKEIIRLDQKNFKYSFTASDVIYDKINNHYIFAGEYYPKDEIKSEGICLITVGADGKVKSENYSSWKTEIAKLMPVSAKGKIEDDRSIFIHKITPTSDGKYFVVAEQFKKAVSGLGVASAILSGGRGGVAMTKIVVYDLMVFEFDAALKIKNITVIEKEKSSIQLPQGAGVNGTTTLGYYIKWTGQFDYAFLVNSTDKKTFTSSFINYDKEKGESNNYVIGTVSYNKEQKLVSDKFRLSTKPSSFAVLPAKPGYIAVFEYYRKEKKIDVRLEKLNI